jgi:hypothetical protein
MKTKMMTILLILVLLLVGCETTTRQEPFVLHQDLVSLEDRCDYERRQLSFDTEGGYATFESFNGTMTLYEIDANMPITLTVSSPRGQNNFKVVLVDLYDRVVYIDQNNEVTLSEGIYRLRLVGENATGSVFVSLDSDGFQSVTQA